MALSVSVPNAEILEEGVWKAKLGPSEIKLLGDALISQGGVSVVLVPRRPRYDVAKKTLEFELDGVTVLNAGDSQETLFVAGKAENDGERWRTDRESVGDQHFLAALPENLRALGEEFLRRVRAEFRGDLRFFPRSGKYVESPDNFWTVRPQPRDRSFRITVRGRPEEFSETGSLIVRPDMGSYSSFKLRTRDEIEDAIKVLRQARRR